MGPALNELATLLDRTSDSISRVRRLAGIVESRSSEPDKEKKRKTGK
jgi:hypothetical protein